MPHPIPTTMRAIVYRGANDLRLETVPVPAIQRRELLVKVAVCGVCPTDIKKIQHGTCPRPASSATKPPASSSRSAGPARPNSASATA